MLLSYEQNSVLPPFNSKLYKGNKSLAHIIYAKNSINVEDKIFHYKNSIVYSDVHIELVLYNLNRLRLSLLNKKENDEIKEKYRTKKYTQKQLAEEYELDIWDIKSILNNRKYWI